MTRSLRLLLLISLVGCARDQPAERVQFYEINFHRWGTNLPPWAACWFPHRANQYAMLDAQPCPPETRATRAWTVRELAGCWMIAGELPTASDSAFFAAPVRLLPHASARDRRFGWDAPDWHGVEPLAPGADTAEIPLVHTLWGLGPPDSLWIGRSIGYGGIDYVFRVRGDSLIGMAQGWTDVIMYSVNTLPEPVWRVHGRRVACPARR